MPQTSSDLLEEIRLAHRKDIDLSLRGAYRKLLADLGNPQDNLPPVIHVAGTNGKGSTCAFLRAIAEACGKKAHVYTSPHLLSYHERIRVAGSLIGEESFVALLREIQFLSSEGELSIFEALTAAALAAFARTPADVTILEVGLGGRLDATNVVPTPAATVISRLSYDHRDYLGNTMEAIAREKAGIMRADVPCFTAPQPSAEAMMALRDQAQKKNAPLFVGGEDWRIEAVDADHFRVLTPTRTIEALPRPALIGTHQLWNAGLAISCAGALPFAIPDDAFRTAMRTVEWQGRLQKITQGPLRTALPDSCDLWLDGGHNDSAGEILSAQLRRWQSEEGGSTALIYAMLSSKTPEEFLAPMLPFIGPVRTLRVDGEVPGRDASELADQVRALGLADVAPSESVTQAIGDLVRTHPKAKRILVCGSLYLVGKALQENIIR